MDIDMTELDWQLHGFLRNESKSLTIITFNYQRLIQLQDESFQELAREDSFLNSL